MLKLIAGLVLLLLLITASVYLVIPSKIVASENADIPCTINGINRYVLDARNWHRWWPGDVDADSTSAEGSFRHNGFTFKISKFLYNRVNVVASDDRGLAVMSTLTIIDKKDDSVSVHWDCRLSGDINPFIRIKKYRFAGNLDKSMRDIVGSLKHFLSSRDSIYGISIQKVSITDTLMIASRSVSLTYPGPAEIKALTDRLGQYITRRSGKQTGNPMVNIDSGDKGYLLMVAVPTDKELKDSGDILFKSMPAVSILMTEVKGGPYTVKNALLQMKTFMQDYGIASPAIPFESLVTDRSAQADTSKWITRVYHPAYYGKE